MKKAIIIFSIALAVGLGTVFIFAQKGGRGDFGPMGFGKGGFGGRGFEHLAQKLGLSDEQKTQARQILDDSKSRIQPLAESLRSTHEQIEKLGTDGVYNETEVARLADLQSTTMKQLIVEKEKTKAQLFAILTPEQRAQASELKNSFKERFRSRFGGGFRKGGPGMFED